VTVSFSKCCHTGSVEQLTIDLSLLGHVFLNACLFCVVLSVLVYNEFCFSQVCAISYPARISCAKTLIELENFDVCFHVISFLQ